METLAASVARALMPLAEALAGDEGQIADIVHGVGYALPSVPPGLTALGTTAEGLLGSLADFEEAAALADPEAEDVPPEVLAAGALVAADLAALAVELDGLPDRLRAELPAAYVAATGIDTDLGPRLLHAAIDDALMIGAPIAAAILRLMTIREVEERDADPARHQPEYVHRELRLDRIAMLLDDPVTVLSEAYGWGTPEIDRERLFEALLELTYVVNAPGRLRYPPEVRVLNLAPGVDVTSDDVLPEELVVPAIVVGPAVLGVAIYPIPATSPAEAQGVALTLALGGELAITVPITRTLDVEIEAAVDLSTGLGVVLRPGRDPEALLRLDEPGGGVALESGRAGVALVVHPASADEPLGLLDLGMAALEAGSISAGGGVDAEGPAPTPYVRGALEGGRLLVSKEGADSFVGTLMPQDGLRAQFDVAATWTPAGLQFEGSAALDIVIGQHLTLGPLLLESIAVRIEPAPGGVVHVEAGITGGAALGPLAVSVDRVGARATVGLFPGNLGPLDLQLGFKPPNGIGLVVDAVVVKGGGYLSIDIEKGEYAGVLELAIKEVVQIKAIALLTTRMPDGSPGFSLMLILTAEFPPIQLGYGFTLNGVGGLAGVNRTIDPAALRAGLRTQALNSILFPVDPVRNAPKVVSDARAIFPPAPGRYVFGPVVKVGWGTPPIVAAQLGVVLEVPEPIRLVILGQLKVGLPVLELPIARINLDAVGIVDFERSELSIDATLYDSVLLVYTLSGDMALRLNWGAQPAFALSVGGLHPRYAPPPGFPALRRITLSLGASDNPRLTCEAYLAITSNSVQLGARAELQASAAGFTVRGYVGFDVLLILSPLSFEADMRAGVELLRGRTVLMGINLRFTLSGPTPWRAVGTASFKILFFTVEFGFDVSWGEDRPAIVPPADARTPLLAALRDSRSWGAALPAGAEQGVSLHSRERVEGAVVAHPLAALTLRQRVAPLNTTLERFGAAPPERWNRFAIADVAVDGQAVSAAPVRDGFATGQFKTLSDDEKLSRPSFEPMDSGVDLGLEGGRHGRTSSADVRYDTTLVDDPEAEPLRIRRPFRPDAVAFGAQVMAGAAARSPILTGGDRRFAALKRGRVTSEVEGHVVVGVDDLRPRTDVAAAGVTLLDAERALAEHLAAHPADARRLQIVGLDEVPA